jgi:hypothetical protein
VHQGEDIEILKNIPIRLDPDEIGKDLHMEGSEHQERIRDLVNTARPLIDAVAACRTCYIDAKFADGVTIEGTRFKSRVLRRNLDQVERVFPYVITIGEALEMRAHSSGDLLEQYCLDGIGNIALVKAQGYLEETLRSRYALGGLSRMNPGSLKDWPIEEQKSLFSVLGDAGSSLGVRLTEGLLMIPRKSLSGICFPTEVPFFSCQLCPRSRCPGRKARYDGRLAREYGLKK